MTKGYTRPARLEDVPVLAANLREADVAEIKASSGRDPEEAIQIGVLTGANVICLHDDTPVAIYGVSPSHVPSLGLIWMVATTDFSLLTRQFLRECRQGMTDLCRDYRLVMNFTDARNHVHHRWLKWMGFTFIKRHEEFGAGKRPFFEFVRITENPYV